MQIVLRISRRESERNVPRAQVFHDGQSRFTHEIRIHQSRIEILAALRQDSPGRTAVHSNRSDGMAHVFQHAFKIDGGQRFILDHEEFQ